MEAADKFAKLVIGGASLWLTGGADLATAKAVLELAENAVAFRTALTNVNLHNVAKRLAASAGQTSTNLAKSPDFAGDALADAQALFDQVLPCCIPGPQEMVDHDLNPDKVIGWMLGQIGASPHATEFRRTNLAERFLREITDPILTSLFADTEFREGKMRALIDSTLLAAQKRTGASIAKLLEQGSEAKAAREQGLPDHQIDAIAERLTQRIHDLDQARATFETAVENAVNERLSAQRLSNAEPATSGYLQAARALSDAGNFDDASASAAQILSRMRADEKDHRSQAIQRELAVLEFKITQDYIRLDAPAIAESELQKVTLESAAAPVFFNSLRRVQDGYFERGRDKGINFDLRVSIELARRSMALADEPDQHVAALINLAISLSILGEREIGTALLQEAVTVNRNALTELSREQVPLNWAATQNNLGNALFRLGEREIGTARLHEAITAYRDALQEYTRDLVPLDWAMTQNNLGNALRSLSEREIGTARMQEAVTAYRDALKERTRDRVPLDWATTQNNLGIALRNLGSRVRDDAVLAEAITAFRDVLRERTRERVPLDWAATQDNLGSALATLGDHTRDTSLLLEAVVANREALLERTRERVPLGWATTQNNLAINYLKLFGLSADPAYLAQAREANTVALNLLLTTDARDYLAKAETTRQAILAATPTPVPTP